jgi:hypothetical protein
MLLPVLGPSTLDTVIESIPQTSFASAVSVLVVGLKPLSNDIAHCVWPPCITYGAWQEHLEVVHLLLAFGAAVDATTLVRAHD